MRDGMKLVDEVSERRKYKREKCVFGYEVSFNPMDSPALHAVHSRYYSCPTGVPPDGGTLARPRKLGLASTLKSA